MWQPQKPGSGLAEAQKKGFRIGLAELLEEVKPE